MSGETNGFDAYISHPQFGYELAQGHFVFIRNGLQFTSDADPFPLPFEQITVKLGKDENWINLVDRRQPDLEFFVTHDILEEARFVQAPHIRSQLERIFSRRELSHRLKVTLGAFLAFAFVAWLASFAMGWGVRMIVRGIPASQEIAFGNDAFKQVEPELVIVDDTNALSQLQAIAAPLLPSVPAHGIPFQFYIVVGSPNAFAMPGGRIVVTTGLLGLMDTSEQLVGVLAHESAHVAQRHMFQHIISGKGPIFLMELITGSHGQLFNIMAYPSELLVYESFSQKYEREADAYGFDYLVAAHINPHGLIEALQKLRNYESSTDADTGPTRGAAFRSHPDLDMRIAWLQAKWDALPDKTHFITFTNLVPKVAENAKLENPRFKLP